MTQQRGRSKLEATKDFVEVVAIIVAGFWASCTFWYQESQRPAALAVSASLEEVGRRDGMALVRLNVHAVNRSNSKVYVPAFWYTVEGLRISRDDAAEAVSPSVIDDVIPQPRSFAQ